ncbi:DUF6896 domain-containing protein [Pseudonocardia oroxyli]|uniref:DUF6896 domain-containing protein n=1 Tax=Pseudonocardia oroxyli TaxID=366584 RepID=UPI003CCBFBD1
MNDVERYLAGLERVRLTLRESGTSSGGVLGLMRRLGLREIPKVGTIQGDVEYEFHGVGCRFTFPDGDVIDVDIVNGVEAFDAWRVLLCVADGEESSGRGLREIRRQCDSLVRTGRLVQLRPGWYSDQT